MAEYKFELEISPYCKHRSELLKSKRTPKLSDAQANLGDVMAKVMFDKCEEALREDFGLTVPLKGPGNLLWVSPSDLLIGKIALKPPFTPKCLQALTHKGILEIGQGLENKFRQEMELDKQRVLDRYKDELLASVDDRMKLEIKDVEIRERLNCHMEMEKMQQDFELLLKEELDMLEKKIREQYEEIISNHEFNLKAKWEDKLQKEVKKTVDMMTKQYLIQLDEQQQKLTEVFQIELKKQEMLKDFYSKLHRRKTMESLRQLKHNLECTNLVNMMYILCIERRKCCEKISDIEKNYQNEIEEVENRLKEKDQLINKVTAEKEKEIQEVAIRETCLREVIRHFQKFINFALRAAPTQAEFLLSVEKMMVFELTKEVVNLDVKKNREATVDVPWRHDGKSTSPSVKVSGLEIQDHHDCLRELNPPIKENAKGELGEDDILPAIYFKNKTYVREDFRDMLSAGMTISPSNELWNRDVDILLAIWRKEHETEQSLNEENNQKTPTEEKNLGRAPSLQSERRRSNKSTVQFSNSDNVEENRALKMSFDSNKALRKTSLKLGSFTLGEELLLEQQNETTSEAATILAARDSVDLVLEKIQKSRISTLGILAANEKEDVDNEETKVVDFYEESLDSLAESKPNIAAKELVQETRDSIIIRMSEMAKTQSSGDFMTTPRDSLEIVKEVHNHDDLKRASSKLGSARNSVEILRQSLHKFQIPAQICQRKDSKKLDHKKDTLQSITEFKGLCCERCKRKEAGIDSPVSDDGGSIADDQRSVKISHVQIFNLEDYVHTPSVVSFDTEPAVIVKDTTTRDTGTNVTENKQTSQIGTRQKLKGKRKKSQSKPIPPYHCKVAGDITSKEADQSIDEFTVERVHSLIKIMSDNPFLMQLFTAGIR